MATRSGDGFTMDVRADLSGFMNRLGAFRADNVPFVTAYALTKTAQDVKAAEVAEMARVFDRPTRFTLNALKVTPATKRNLTAKVDFKEGFGSIPAWRYLGPQVEGGPRAKKTHERALQRAGLLRADEFCVPGQAAQLDAYGNMPGSAFTRILSDLGANPDPMQNSTAKSRRTKKGRARGRYFILRGTKAPDGIYQRTGSLVAVPVLIFVKQPTYAKRLPFYEVAKRVMQANFARHYSDGWARFGPGRKVAA